MPDVIGTKLVQLIANVRHVDLLEGLRIGVHGIDVELREVDQTLGNGLLVHDGPPCSMR